MKSRKLSPTAVKTLAARVEQTPAQPLLTVAHPTELATVKTLRSSIGNFSFFFLLLPYLFPAGKGTRTTDTSKPELLRRTGGRHTMELMALSGAKSLEKAMIIEDVLHSLVNSS